MSSVSSDEVTSGKPQAAMNEFWDSLITKKSAKVTKIFPSTLYKNLMPPQTARGTVTGKNAAESYKAAAAECTARVKRLVRECNRTNEKFTDPEFDMSWLGSKNCLEGLMYWYKDKDKEENSASSGPKSVHRLEWIYEKPEFVIDGFSSSDLKQGANGDCWFIAAVSAICSSPELMEKVCVARDEECGIYGFVFYRDGEWIWTVVDDNLYLKYADFDATYGDSYDPNNTREAKWRKNYQTGSDALYFASCADENETWLPLLEKAYAKVHGDYASIVGGWSGEAVEDLTGGVTTKIMSDRVLSKNRLWEELKQVGKKFLFSAVSNATYGDDAVGRRGLALNHAYSVLKAVDEEDEDGKKVRLVLIRNPWGSRVSAGLGEWTGPWSDGSAEWTPYWMNKLGHKFGNDGLFWMSYQDMLERFYILDRTRLFDDQWTIVQRWTSVSVAWVTGFLNMKFSVKINKGGPTVFVLCKLDDRYFTGLDERYNFDLHFVLQEKNAAVGDHIVRVRGPWFGNRTVSAEVDLEAGVYEVLPKIVAEQDKDEPEILDIVKKLADRNPQKLRQIGLNYDIANAKGVIELTEEERKKREKEKKEAAEKKAKEKEKEEKEKTEFEAWKKEEKAEYAAWKKMKEVEEKKLAKESAAKAKEEAKDSETQTEQSDAAKDTKSAEVEKQKDSKPAHDEGTTDASAAKDTAQDTAKDTAKDTAQQDTTPKPTDTDTTASSDPSPENPTSTDASDPPQAAAPVSTDAATEEEDASSGKKDEKDKDKDDKDKDKDEKDEKDKNKDDNDKAKDDKDKDKDKDDKDKDKDSDDEDEDPKPWNAVCVLGLRVYSLDPDVSIQLVKPKDDEEAAILDVDGGTTQAGATM